MEIRRLHLASLQGLDGGTRPVHGFAVTHPGGAVYDWFGFMDARFELVDGDAATPEGSTCSSATQPRQYADPLGPPPDGQASDVATWRDSVHRIRSLAPERVHFCRHTDVVHR